jgi:DNA modification methylase
VLRDDGTCWLNIGDSYANNQPRGHYGDQADTSTGRHGELVQRNWAAWDLKPKDLSMLPARLALALQADGWWLRSDIIWHKPNPMPESVTDRPTSAHEHVFLLTKSERYFYDADAVREAASENTHPGYASNGAKTVANADAFGVKPSAFDGYRPPNRNARNVWTIPTEAFPEAHFATFPTALVERCIKAGTSERGCCAGCGTPWVREVERETVRQLADAVGERPSASTGWAPACRCRNARTKPCMVLDPFGGAGTTGLVADRMQRDAVMVELNDSYCAMVRERIARDCPLFAEIG